MKAMHEIITSFARAPEGRIPHHVNAEAMQFFENTVFVTRLKRFKSFELVQYNSN